MEERKYRGTVQPIEELEGWRVRTNAVAKAINVNKY